MIFCDLAARRLGPWCFFLASALTPPVLFAGELLPPYKFESTSVLPQGIYNPKLTSFATHATSRLDENGNSRSLGEAFQSKVRISQFLGQLDPSQRQKLAGSLKPLNIDPESTMLTTAGSVSADITVAAPVLAYGITDRWTLSLAVPIVRKRFQVSTAASQAPAMTKWLDGLTKIGQAAAAAQIRKATADPIKSMVSNMGYNYSAQRQETELGDLKLIGRYSLSKGTSWRTTILHELTLPTGQQADVNELVDVSSGDSQWDLAAGLAADWMPSPSIQVTSFFRHTIQMPGSTAKRVPTSPDFLLTPLVDPETEHDLGDITQVGLATHFQFASVWTLSGGLNYQKKAGDRYSGQLYEEKLYNYLEINTDQEMLSSIFGLSFSTIPLVKSEKAQLPVEGTLAWTQVREGRNVAQDDVTSLDLAVYF